MMKFFSWLYLAITLILVTASIYVLFNPSGKGLSVKEDAEPLPVETKKAPLPDTSIATAPPSEILQSQDTLPASAPAEPFEQVETLPDISTIPQSSEATAKPDTGFPTIPPIPKALAEPEPSPPVEPPLDVSYKITLQTPPSAPNNLTSELEEDGTTVLYWDSPSHDVKNFIVSWSEEKDGYYRELKPVPGTRSFLELPSYKYSVTRWFRVRAENDYGASLESKPLKLAEAHRSFRHGGYVLHGWTRVLGALFFLVMVVISRLRSSRWDY